MSPEELLVLKDLLEEKGESWVAEVIEQRAYLLELVRTARHAHSSACSYPPPTLVTGVGSHGPNCMQARMLRALGGAEETQRQVDAAHEMVLMRSQKFEENRIEFSLVDAYQRIRNLGAGWRDIDDLGIRPEVLATLVQRGAVRLSDDQLRVAAVNPFPGLFRTGALDTAT